MTRIKLMRKTLAIVATAAILVFLPGAAFAQADGEQTTGLQAPAGSINANINPTNVPQLIINLIFGTGIFLAVAYLMYGGVRWITSRGDKIGVETARKHIMAAIVGLVVVIGTFFIIQVIFRVVGTGENNPLQKGFTLPNLENPTGGNDD